MDKGFEVEWCYELPSDGHGGCDIDNAKYACKDFPNRGLAMAFARRMLPKDCFGSVRVTEFELVPYEPGLPGKCREYVRDSEHVE